MKYGPRGILAVVLLLTTAAPGAAQDQRRAAGANPALAAPAHHTESAGVGDDRPVLQRRNPRYRVCASDVLSVTFPLTPEFDQTLNVQPDGFVSLKGAGDLHLAGLTTVESSEAIRTAYAKILREPIITVELKDFNKPYFIVSGQVHNPGKFDLRGYTSATQAVAIAGGFKDSAKHSQVLLFRRLDDDWFEVTPLNLKRILQGHDVNEDAEVHPGDMLFVPQNVISKVERYIPTSGMGAYYQMHQ